jgi:60 kDa SS-A/Ro ribonucleoprotein
MSRFNAIAKDQTITVNHEGEKAWALSDEMALYTRVVTSIMQDQFYTPDFNDELNRIRALLKKVDPMFAAQLAVYAREEMYLRSIPLVIAIELAKIHNGDNLIRRLTNRVIGRADELTEIMSYYVAANGKRERDHIILNGKEKKLSGLLKKRIFKISKQMSKGIADAFHKFDEYQFKKYEASDKEIKLRDVLFTTCPKPLNEKESELFRKIANCELNKAATWETASSEMGQKVAAEAKKMDLDETQKADLKKSEAKKMWEAKIDATGKGELGYMALMRNLMNFLEYGVSTDHIVKVALRLADPKEVERSKQLPFRFVTAYRMISESYGVMAPIHTWGGGRHHSYANREDIIELNKLAIPKTMGKVSNPNASILLEALEDAVKLASKNIPSFSYDTKVLIAADTSGSMQKPVSEKKDAQGRVVAQSKLLCYDVGLALSMMLQYKCKVVSSGMFGDSFLVVPMPKDQILRNVDEMRNLEGEVGYSTNGYLVIQYAIAAAKKGITYDKVFLFSDNQLWNSASDKAHIDTEWKKFLKVNPNAKLYIFDLSGYGTSPVDLKQNNVYMIAGWSEKIFDILKMIDEGGDALEKIKSIRI